MTAAKAEVMTLQLPKFAQRLNIPPVPSPVPASVSTQSPSPTPSPKIELVVNSPARGTIPPSPTPGPLPSPRVVTLPLPSPRSAPLSVTPTIPVTSRSNVEILTPSRVSAPPSPTPSPKIQLVVKSPARGIIPPSPKPGPLSSPRVVTLPLPSPRSVPLPVTPTIPVTSTSNVEILTPSRSSAPPSPYKETEPWVGVPTPRRTQVYTPRIGIKSPAPQENDPWRPEPQKGAGEIKIAGITPIGNIAPVPTADNRPPPTPRTLQRQIQQQTREETDPVMINATIYLDCTKREDLPYDYVAKRMQSISQTTINLQKQYTNTFQPLPPLSGRVTPAQFEQALAIYENNQVYYQDCIEDQTLSKAEISLGLTTLEHWFVHITEPLTIEGSQVREQQKKRTGLSAYCDPELHSYITPLK